MDKSVIADSVECHGVLTKIADEAFEFIRKHTMYGATITGLKRKETTNIPVRAARELLVNAVVHADYSQQGAPSRVAIYDDRLEIDSPGVLLSGLTVPDIKQGNSKLRNRVIGRVFKELRYIEQWGSGILNAIGECKQMGVARTGLRGVCIEPISHHSVTDNTGRYTEHRGRYPSRRGSALEPHANATYGSRLSGVEGFEPPNGGIKTRDRNQNNQQVAETTDRLVPLHTPRLPIAATKPATPSLGEVQRARQRSGTHDPHPPLRAR
jgi:hypothetical protein